VTPVEAACAELATLTPRLDAALTRDNTHGGRGRAITPVHLYNTDVLLARITLAHEIPAAAIRASQLVREPWQPRTITACLLALPRLADRMAVLHLATEHSHLEAAARYWVRITKRALGLRKPDIPLGVACPICETQPPGALLLAGAEATIRGTSLTWDNNPRVYCTLSSKDDPHVWPLAKWGLLEQLVNA
jgi:hypothetical protein